MSRRDELRLGGERVRIGSWRGSQRIGLVTPLSGPITPSRELVERACAELARRGYHEVLTGALGSDELGGFESCAFVLRDSLHLLVHDLRNLPDATRPPAGFTYRRGNRLRLGTALRVDARAFSPYWRLDDEGLLEALTATTEVRFRVATSGGIPGTSIARRTVAYAVMGLTADMGYLQRLAVDPEVEGRGLGRGLILDGLRWARERGATQAVVNTQVENERALNLYRSVGFQLLPSGLSVLGRSLATSPADAMGSSSTMRDSRDSRHRG